MSFVHVGLGLLVPALLAAYSYQPPHQRHHDHGSISSTGTPGGRASRTRAAALRRLASRADCRIHRLLCGRCSFALRVLVCSHLYCIAWILSKLLAGL